jgi:hypothetical protein
VLATFTLIFQPLFDLLSNGLEKNASGTIILIGRLINNGPSWLSKLPSHEIFARLLELIKASITFLLLLIFLFSRERI